MPTFIVKQKYIFVIVCIGLVVLSTGLFLFSDYKFDIDGSNLKANVLAEDEIDIVQSEEFYRDLVGNDDDALFILKTDSLIHFSCESWRNEFGYSSEEVNNVNFFTFVHPKDLPYFVNSMISVMQHEEKVDNVGPFRVKDNEGKYRLYMGTVLPLFNHEGGIAEIALTLRDVSMPLGDEEDEISLLPTAFAAN